VVAELPDWTKQGANHAWVFSRIKEGDRIVANRGTHEVLGIGTVSGPYYYVDGEKHAHRLPVHWDDTTARSIEENGWRKTIIKLDQDKFETLQKAPPKDGGPQPPPDDKNPVYSLTMLAEETGMDEALLQRWVNAIERKGQAILYGPPGTGKTYISEHMAKHLIGGTDGFPKSFNSIQLTPMRTSFRVSVRKRLMPGNCAIPSFRAGFWISARRRRSDKDAAFSS
jgi:5-methylcytosine-specific restriction protein B